MLPAAHRLTDGETFRHAVRRGRRAGGTLLVVHLAVSEWPSPSPARVGFVVSKAVGNAVVRNRVKRRLRHVVRDHLATLDALAGAVLLVVRAQPAAAGASSAELGLELARCLDKTMSHVASSSGTSQAAPSPATGPVSA